MHRRTKRIAVGCLLVVNLLAVDLVPAMAEQETSKVAIRIPPNRNDAINIEVLALLEKYFQWTKVVADAGTTASELSQRQCGRTDDAWIVRFLERNKVTIASDTQITAGQILDLPPCAVWQLGGTITIDRGETIGSEVFRTMGGGVAMQRRVANLNGLDLSNLHKLRPGTNLRLPFTTSVVSLSLKPDYAPDIDKIIVELSRIPGSSARRDDRLALVAETTAGCDADAVPPDPFDTESLADILVRNANLIEKRVGRPGPYRKTPVAVIDTGVDPKENRLFFATDADGGVGISIEPRGGYPTTPAPYQWREHGTHVAGLVLGGFRSQRLTDLVAKRIELRIINVVAQEVRASGVDGAPQLHFEISVENLNEAINYARSDPPIPILSLSIRTERRLASMLTQLKLDGEWLVVAAAGNDNWDLDTGLERVYPASFKSELPPARLLSVAAHDGFGALAPFSNRGRRSVDIAAPGCLVSSLMMDGKVGPMSGTSQAAPLVTFTAALLYAEGLSVREVANRIRLTARAGPGFGSVATGGILDIPAALSVYDDRVTLADGSTLVGRFVDLDCLRVGTHCFALKSLGRLVPSADRTALTIWKIHPDSLELNSHEIPMLAENFRFLELGGAERTVEWADVKDVIFAWKRQ